MAEIRLSLDETFSDEFKRMLLQAANEVIQEAAAREKKSVKDWMQISEACEWLGISYPTFAMWRKLGLKVAVVQGKTLVGKSEITRFLTEHQQ